MGVMLHLVARPYVQPAGFHDQGRLQSRGPREGG